MIIKYIIDTFVTPKIETLNFVDRYSSVVSEVEITTHAKGGAKMFKKYPVAAGVTATDCNNESLYQDLVPNDSKSSVIYWELTQPMQNVGKTPNVTTFNQQRYRGTARIIVWLNMAKLGFSEVAPQNRTDGKIHTLPALMKAISFEGKLDSGIYANDNVTIVPQRIITDKAQIFGKYAYSKDRNWFLYPYDFFAIDVTFTLDTCLANPYEFPLGAAIDCVGYSTKSTFLPETNSFVFDGVNESIRSNDVSEYGFEFNEAFSISTWVKFNSISGTDIFVSKRHKGFGVNTGFRVQRTSGRIRFGLSNFVGSFTEYSIDTTEIILPNVWYNITVTNGVGGGVANMKIYIDGNLEPTTVFSNNLSGSIINFKPLQIGSGDDELYMNGYMCNVRIWDKELTQAEVTEEYNTGLVRPEPTANANNILDTDIKNAVWGGVNWTMSNKKGGASFTSINMEETDRTTDIPS